MTKPTIMARAAMAMIRFYQRRISPHLGARCKFYPTCSQYALTAVERYGFMRGAILATWRILRCNPFSKGGYDPVDPADYITDSEDQ